MGCGCSTTRWPAAKTPADMRADELARIDNARYWAQHYAKLAEDRFIHEFPDEQVWFALLMAESYRE